MVDDRSAASRRPVRHGPAALRGQRVLRPKMVAGVALAFVMVVAGLTVMLVLVLGPGGDDSAAVPAPRVTVTAGPDGGAPDVNAHDGTGPITAQESPDSGAAHDPPKVVVGPGIDLSQHSLDDPGSPWVVVNKTRPIDPPSWEPPQLERAGEAELVPQAAAALEEMLDAADAASVPLRTGTGYRGYGFQQTLYADYAAEHGAERADRFSARPGFSEHQTGWAVDVYSSEECRIQECFADEPAGVWVADHAHEYGFVTRYPRGAEDITGYRFEPWHIRYVGPELATAMRENNIATLEQALSLPAAPDYE